MTDTKKIKALVIESSAVVQRLLEYTINANPRLKVVGIATGAETTLPLLPRLNHDVDGELGISTTASMARADYEAVVHRRLDRRTASPARFKARPKALARRHGG